MQPVNVSQVPIRSPFRYPGGKSWLVPVTHRWLAARRPYRLVELFAGGASVGLSALFDDQVQRLTLIEKDDAVADVWEAVVASDQADRLCALIADFRMSAENVEAVLEGSPTRLAERAFRTILSNRVRHGGIMAPGASLMKGGENGRGLLSRWYAGTLVRRLQEITAMAARIEVLRGDALAYLKMQAPHADVAYFADPPYAVAGRRLYAHWNVDHDRLLRVLADPSREALICYENSPEVRGWAQRHGLVTRPVVMRGRRNAVIKELLLARDFTWLD